MQCRTVLHAGFAAMMLVPAVIRAGEAVVWKTGDRGVTLQDVPAMSGKTRLGRIPAGVELTAKKVEGKWILVEAAISGEGNKRQGWVASELLGRLPSELPTVFPKDIQGTWTRKDAARDSREETLIVREGYLLWIRRAGAAHLIRSTDLTGVTRSGRAGTGWGFDAAQFKVPYIIGMPFPPREGAKPVIVQRGADVCKKGKEIVLALDATETIVRGTPPAIPRGARIQIMDYVTNSQGEVEGVYRISIPKEACRFRRLPAEPKMQE